MELTFGREHRWAVVMDSHTKKRTATTTISSSSTSTTSPLGTPSNFFFNVFLSVVATSFIFIYPTVQGKEEICVVKTPLNSPYFIPYVETTNPCDGCSYLSKLGPLDSTNDGETPENSAIHVIQMENVVDSVLQLDIIDKLLFEESSNGSSSWENPRKTCVFVITSSEPLPISIVIHTQLTNVTFKFLTRPQDHLHFYGSSSEHSVSSRMWKTPEEALEGTKLEFGFISTFTRSKHVNKIYFDLSNDGLQSDDCSIHTDKETSVSKCSLVIKMSTSGCFHEHMLGYHDSDIHIIDIESEFGVASSERKITLHITDTEDETLRNPTDIPIKRNLTLILRSTLETVWSLKVSNIQGIITLYLVDGGQVENKSCPGVSVSVQRLELPKTFDQTLLHVLTKIGPMVSYTHTKAPSIIELVVPAIKRSKTAKHEGKLVSTDLVHAENAINLLENSLEYECFAGHMILSLPLWVERRVGGISMNLRDHACGSYNNDSHLVIRSRFTECGFVQQTLNNYYLYTNIANIEFGLRDLSLTDDEDFEGSGFEPSISDKTMTKILKCKSSLKLQQKPNLESLKKDIEYSLKVYRDENLLTRIKRFPTTIPSDSTIYAKVEFVKEPNKTPDLKIIIEQCFLSSSPHYATRQVALIRKSCASQQYVTIEKSYINSNAAFHFLLSMEFLLSRRVYLHCKIGVCWNDLLPQPSLNKCADPSRYCTKDILMKAFDTHVMASVIDTIVVGPFDVEPVKERIASTHKMPPGGKTPIYVMEGLSTEVVVGIAIGSFIIGVCLTATLWIIYLKTDPRRQSRPESVIPRNSAYDLSGHSGSSTPSSQAPMTT